VRAGEALLTAHHNHEARHAKTMELLRGCFEIGAERPEGKPLVREMIGTASGAAGQAASMNEAAKA
ncbi:MAG: hypothetical protein ACRD3S_06645, partial [Terracidiphilus sp.]